MSDDLLTPPASETLLVVDELDGPQQVFRLSGEMDLSNSALVRDGIAVGCRTQPRTVVDLSELTFCDATGITALLTVQERFDSLRCGLSFRGLPPQIARLLHIAGVDGGLTLEPSV